MAELDGCPCVLRDESFLLAPHRASCSGSSQAAHLASPEAREWTQQWLLQEGFEEGLGLEVVSKRPCERTQAEERRTFRFRLPK